MGFLLGEQLAGLPVLLKYVEAVLRGLLQAEAGEGENLPGGAHVGGGAGLDGGVDAVALADIACVNGCYLIRLFKREVGLSPLRYINQKKIEKAQLLLLTADMPVKEIAYELGFFDLSYFIRLFKKKVGVTPQEYRASMR